MSPHDPPRINLTVKAFRLLKFAGDRQPGQRPIEILTGGPDAPTRTVRPGDPDYDALCAKEGL